jgi:hypothetical protein
VDVPGIFYSGGNGYMLRKGDPKGERLAAVAKEEGILLMICDQSAIQKEFATGEIGDSAPSGTVDGVLAGCFSDLYVALPPNPPEQVFSL